MFRAGRLLRTRYICSWRGFQRDYLSTTSGEQSDNRHNGEQYRDFPSVEICYDQRRYTDNHKDDNDEDRRHDERDTAHQVTASESRCNERGRIAPRLRTVREQRQRARCSKEHPQECGCHLQCEWKADVRRQKEKAEKNQDDPERAAHARDESESLWRPSLHLR